MTDAGRPRVGVSACLLGRNVRYDGDHKRDDVLLEALGPVVEWVPVCPELEIGMGVPREPVELVREPPPGIGLRMVGVISRDDWTSRMNEYAARRLAELPPLSGYVLKSRSPSCGLVVANVGEPGLFARALRDRFPDLPIAEESQLGDADARRSFVERILAYHERQRVT